MRLASTLVFLLAGSALVSGDPVGRNASAATQMILAPAVVQPAPTKLSGRSFVLYVFPARFYDAVTLTWQDHSSSEYSFRIERCRGVTCTNFTEVAKTAPNVVRYGLLFGHFPGVVYRFRVRAYGSHGFSAYSNIVTVALAK